MSARERSRSGTPRSGSSGPAVAGQAKEGPVCRGGGPSLTAWCRRRSGWCRCSFRRRCSSALGVAVAIEVVLLSFLGGQRTWLRQALDVDHLIERVGLLVVIVFGESILAIIAELDATGRRSRVSPRSRVRCGVDARVDLLRLRHLRGRRGLRRLQLRGSIGGLRDTVMYLPFLLVAGIALFAAGLGTAVADAGHHLPIGAAVCLTAGVSLFFIASTAESLRYGAPWGDVVCGAGGRAPAVAAGAAVAVGDRSRGGGIRRCDRCAGRAQRDQLPAGAGEHAEAARAYGPPLAATGRVNSRRARRCPGHRDLRPPPYGEPCGRPPGGAPHVVPVVGLEPTRPLGQSILSAPRLPFRHTGAQVRERQYRRIEAVTDKTGNESPLRAPPRRRRRRRVAHPTRHRGDPPRQRFRGRRRGR